MARLTPCAQGLPASPTAEFAHAPDVEIEVLEDDEWRPLEAGLHHLATRLRDLEAREVPTAEEAAPEIEKRLEEAREQIGAQTANLETLRTEYDAELQDHRAIESRLLGLESRSEEKPRCAEAQRVRVRIGTDSR